MDLIVITAIVIIAIVPVVVLKFKSMRAVDVAALVMTVRLKLGIVNFLAMTGLNKKMRPKVSQIVGPNGQKLVVINPMANIFFEPIRTLKMRADDVLLASYPKAGTTWMQEITWLICNNADIDEADKQITLRSPFLETVDIGTIVKGIQSIENWPRNKQRVIKTHLPYGFLPEEFINRGKCKMIYVARNPKDLSVSHYFFNVMNYGMPDPVSWSQFLTDFCSGNIGYGDWFDHNLKYWKEYQENRNRIYFTTYEALKKDLRSELIRISKFLEKDLTDYQLDKIAEHCTFESMSKNNNTNYSEFQHFGLDFTKTKFMRKGQVGDWKNYFTLNENAAFDAMYEERMKDSGLNFSFEL